MTRSIRASCALLAVLVVACQPSSPPPVVATVTVRTLAVVVVVAQTGAPLGGETNTSGTARLAVRPGAYSVQVTPPARTRFGEGRAWTDALDADAGVVVKLDPHSTITGNVKDERGAAVSDAQICAHPPTNESPKCARSGGDGKFTIDVRSDVYKLEVDGPTGGKLVPQWASGRLNSGDADIVDVRSRDAEGIEVAMIKGVVLSGVVRGPNGAIEDAQVCTRTLAAPLPWDCVRTKKDGSYVALMETGRYYMWTVPPDNLRLMAQWYDHVLQGVDTEDIAMDRDRRIDVDLDPGPQIRGKVTTTDGQPVSGAFVCVDTPFPTGRICRPTSWDGSYAITTRPQTYTVQVLPPHDSDLVGEFWLRKRTWVDANDVSLGSADRTLDLTLRHGVRVTGVIRDTRGVPLEGATINFNDEEGPLVGTDTDVSGTYSVVVPRGTYQVEVFAPFRGERGDLLSQEPRALVVDDSVRYDAVLEDANP
ncbi:MAG: carboxypeptidase regulatory-like domain-containing protein [Chloroflexi bacterium]|nr:MAG: carboxypeptidase regulatory-like domain-containing protein [Chloroflexota bacterium]